MKIYITKYALTRGIVEREIEELGYYYVLDGYICYPDKDLFLDKETAIENANAQKSRKIKTLQKQIEKLSNTFFE
jgi:hypothetical protein